MSHVGDDNLATNAVTGASRGQQDLDAGLSSKRQGNQALQKGKADNRHDND